MPCNSDYMKQTREEAHNQRTAKLLKYALETLEKKVPKWVKVAAKEEHCKEDRSTAALCKLIEPLSAQDYHRIINVESKKAIKLADWWTKHQEADKKRKKKEASNKADQKVLKELAKKLSPREAKALGKIIDWRATL